MQLELKKICTERGGREILHDISLSVEQGVFVSLLGASGCGKTTLLQTIAGILPQSKGSVWIGGQPVDRLPAHKRGTAIVFQDTRLFPHMTVAENVAFPLRMQGIKRREALRAASELLARTQLAGYDRLGPHQLSGGQQQRVALARALAAHPGVLLLDEPFSGLDENLRDDMRGLVRALHEDFQMTSVLVTHDRQEALSLSDQVILMHEGRILQSGAPRDLYANPCSPRVAAYFGETVFLSGRVENGRFTCPMFSAPTGGSDGAYTAALRPHDLTAVPGTACRLTRMVYQGAYTLGYFRHLQTGQDIPIRFLSDCPWQVGQTADVTPRNRENIRIFPSDSMESDFD